MAYYIAEMGLLPIEGGSQVLQYPADGRSLGSAVACDMPYPDFRHVFSRFDGRTSI